jgi:hypothetical protein
MRGQSDRDVLDEKGRNVLREKLMASRKLYRVRRMAGKFSGLHTRGAIALFLGAALLAAIPCCAMGQAAKTESNLAGSWKGELGEGAGKLHLILTITKLAGGEFFWRIGKRGSGRESSDGKRNAEGRCRAV